MLGVFLASLITFRLINFCFVCICVSSARMHAYCVHAWCSRKSEEGLGPLGAAAVGGGETLGGCCDTGVPQRASKCA